MSRWQLNRVGLLDFWYYDDQDFETVDGRILLRGSNGSGKSVTMQSFIPLLLDGNMRPERLDPFGSRARKMENYLLEEDDDREERTGYLYMEFKREDSDVFETVGIGLRARKNKKLETWYFSLTDGRRVGKNFFLYKDLQSKITCSKQELKNRLGEGGRIMESQGEYLKCVNQLLFGFETIEEYQELIDLLLQLRTPKLSKEFKPTVINEILSRSLQTLSEDDLRPMSEAIENMDAQATNLSALNESILAAEGINRIYRQYNEIVLYDKALLFSKTAKDYRSVGKTAEELKKQRADFIEQGEQEKKRYEQLEQEETILKKEYESLRDSDASKLKEEELRLTRESKEKKEELGQKERQEQEKSEKHREAQTAYRRQEEENQQIWENISRHLEEMGETIEEVPFDEFTFMKEELLLKPEEEYEFGAHLRQLQDYKKKVEAAKNVLAEEANCRKRYDQIQEELDQAAAEKDRRERSFRQQENLLQEEKSRAIEAFYEWEKGNSQLHLSDETKQNITRGLEGYQWGKDYVEIRDLARGEFYEKEGELKNRVHLKIQEEKALQEKIEQSKLELEEWKNKEDPEPECSEAVWRNRRRLEQEKIPFLPFYKTIDFDSRLTKEQASCLEEMLLEMGVLNALIIPAEYRERVLKLDKGVCDKYIFSDVKHIKENLNTILDVDNGENDILLYQTVSNILSSIGVYSADEQEKGSTWLDLAGHYQLGVLEGTITGEYETHYVGLRARQKFRQERLAQLALTLEGLKKELEVLTAEITRRKEEMRINEEEWNNFPGGEDLKEAAKMLYECETELEVAEKAVGTLREQLAERKSELDEIILRVRELCSRCYMRARLDIYENAIDCLQAYEVLLTEVRVAYEKYRNGLLNCRSKQELMEDIDADLEEIRYEKGRISKKVQELEASLYSVREQLKLTDYDQIKERLDICLERLNRLPGEKEDAVKKAQEWETKTESLQEKINEQEQLLLQLRRSTQLHEKAFQAEYGLGYVEKNYVLTEDMEDQANKTVQMLAGRFGNKKQPDVFATLQEMYHSNKGELREYQPTLQSIFEELDEGTDFGQISMKRIDIQCQYRGVNVRFGELLKRLYEDREILQKLITDKDKELFEDILANTISKKIRVKIHASRRWVKKMNDLMDSMQTSSGLKLSLNWKSKRGETEEQLDTGKLVELLQKDSEIMSTKEVEKLSQHFRSKIVEARKLSGEGNSIQSFHGVMREVLDYRKWFEFTLEYQKTGERKKELTDRVFFTFSGGEKAMSMYVPLFSAVVAKYAGAREEAPRLVSLDEAFAGVDEMNIRDMFRLMRECEFNFMLNSQVLWGDYDTMPGLAIYQLLRPENAKFVTVIKYVWNGEREGIMPERLLMECVAYFKERSVYKVLFKKISEKYYSLGHLGGSVTLAGLTLEEKQQLSGFFQKDFTENKTITISVRLMEKALADSKFGGLNWQDILEAYQGEVFLSKKEAQLRQEEEKTRFFEQLIGEFGESPGGDWLEWCLQEKKEGYGLLMLHYRQRREELSAILKAFLAGVEKLPVIRQKQENEKKMERVRIPVFAARISGNPHFFDQGTLAERLLILFLRDYCRISDSSKDQLLYTAGLLRDDLSNYTLAYGVEAEDSEGNVHSGIEGFVRRKEPVQLTLLTVSRLGKVWPKVGKKVYIVENPAVFSALAEAKPDIALICGNGQIRMATFALLDLFEKDVEFWYAGDFDPEGLLIAQRLRKRYGSRLVFWKYEEGCYLRYLSDVVLDSHRIKKLDKVEEEELIELKEAIKRTGRVTYQELMIQEYLKE